MIPKEATKKKEDAQLIFFREFSGPLYFAVKSIVKELGKYLALRYPNGEGWRKEEDIKSFWEDTYKTPYPEKIINMDSRTKKTIAISILTYQLGCNSRKLFDIYSKDFRVKQEKMNRVFMEK